MKTINLESDSSPALKVHIKWLLRLYVGSADKLGDSD